MVEDATWAQLTAVPLSANKFHRFLRSVTCSQTLEVEELTLTPPSEEELVPEEGEASFNRAKCRLVSCSSFNASPPSSRPPPPPPHRSSGGSQITNNHESRSQLHNGGSAIVTF